MKLVIADDEIGIVLGLQKIIGKYLPACEVVGTAMNGIEGAKVVRELKPDIVMTDIRMPQSDGLEMIGLLKAEGCKAKFIILSGYAEFEYAKRGIELGVKFFINKPVEEEELQACVYKVMEEIERERRQTKQFNELMLKEIAEGGYEPNAHDHFLVHMLSFPLAHHRFVAALAEMNEAADNMTIDPLSAIMEMLGTELAMYSHIKIFRYEERRLAIIIADPHPAASLLSQALQRARVRIESRLNIKLTVAVGREYDSIRGIQRSFVEAMEALSSAIPKKRDIIAEVKGYMAEHYGENITLADLAGRFYINPNYLSQLFKEKTGDTYLSVLLHIRMNKAKELLEKSDLKVYEICQKVGYADTGYFSKLFERTVGCTPTEYRNRSSQR
ncbi:helix-turn-helix domain-containing protein [Paenibacillus arenilitoris]|uniref:Helix-turn-helix domain-containing protein n=1 Tax=Paenibacillus arenilitoris TaxID=2772299 RepID=A0A927H3K7_9BACL|nr:helix-turn-helix domain-containing protein [Paenibacillus arenilitoris]MBD2866960.1 helix-turn-helix domain-containing protein [Paenibacillus arenilitoris]